LIVWHESGAVLKELITLKKPNSFPILSKRLDSEFIPLFEKAVGTAPNECF